ncbi:uncharacterized protein [Diadema antillarum]|uniref:uncharacterized protein n=1 Tax=Diadema antillarum TaxID=105358 RepID=UPI003A8A0E17
MLQGWSKHFIAQGLTEETADIMAASWRKSTKEQYMVYIRKWQRFCHERHLCLTHTKVGNLFAFFNSMYKNGASYSTLNTSRSALASVVLLQDEKYTISTHPWICRYFKGIFNLRPPTPRYSFIWDVGKVLSYLRQVTPAHKISLCQLTHKVCFLLALTSAQRVQTLSYLTLDNVKASKDCVEIAVADLIKQSQPGNVGVKVTLKAFPEDKKLCVVHYVKEYINRTSTLRKEVNALVVTYKQPHGKASKQTIARWIKTVLKASGIDTDLFKAHSTRSAATSSAKRNHFPIADILKHAGWKNESTFRNFYLKPASQATSFGQAVLGQQTSRKGQDSVL